MILFSIEGNENFPLNKYTHKKLYQPRRDSSKLSPTYTSYSIPAPPGGWNGGGDPSTEYSYREQYGLCILCPHPSPPQKHKHRGSTEEYYSQAVHHIDTKTNIWFMSTNCKLPRLLLRFIICKQRVEDRSQKRAALVRVYFNGAPWIGVPLLLQRLRIPFIELHNPWINNFTLVAT